MNIKNILEFFYQKASERIKKEVEASGLTHREIYMRDSKQISWIINNNKTKNNRFLITDAVLENCDDFGNPNGLLPKLSFKNIKEILWGTDDEIANYLPELFKLLWNEITSEDNPYEIDKELFLCDYVPYAKYSTYWNILFSPTNKYLAITYGIFEDDVVENIDYTRNCAFKYLYNKCQNNFANIFSQFTDKTKSFSRINHVFKQSFLEDLFIPMLKEYTPNECSLGLRVKSLIESDLLHCASLVYKDINSNYLVKLINASSTYIVALEDIQNSEHMESINADSEQIS